MQIDRTISILVVDDFSTMRRIVSSLLTELGFTHIDQADDGQTAWPMIQTAQYGLIISDLNMPTMSGLQLLKKIRADAHLNSTPFLLITAETKRQLFEQANQLGVDGFIVKPFSASTLNSQIETVLKAHTQRVHLTSS